MKNIILKVLLLLLGTQLYAQSNLIRNPSFELGTIPPTAHLLTYAYTFRENVTYWEEGCSQQPGLGNTPDILTTGATDCPAGAPTNNWTNGTGLNPQLGNRYVYCGYSTQGFGESVKGQLTQTLTAGTYNISFYGSKVKGKNYCGWNNTIAETYPPNTVGAVVEVVLSNSANACTGQTVVWTSPAITSLDSWQQLSGSFVIDCDKAAMNFNRIEFRIKTPSSSKGFFIDNVSLTKVNLTPVITGADDFCQYAPIYFLGSLSPGVTSVAYLWELQECTSTGSLIGSPLYSSWFFGTPSGFTFPSSLNLQCGKYYRVKLAPSNNVSCEWVERTKIIKINCDPAHNCPDPCFSVNNVSYTQNESSLYGPMPVHRLCSAPATINGSCSTNESGYHLRIGAFNLNTFTFVTDFHNDWVTGTGPVPTYLNLNYYIGSNSFVPGQVYAVALTVGPGWYSGEIRFFRIEPCLIGETEPKSLSMSDLGMMSVYPNPTTGNVVVNLGKAGTGAIEIYSLDGKLVHNSTFAESRELNVDLSNFSKGIYMAKVTIDGETVTQKIIKE